MNVKFELNNNYNYNQSNYSRRLDYTNQNPNNHQLHDIDSRDNIVQHYNTNTNPNTVTTDSNINHNNQTNINSNSII
jgi:hypothetical protein